MRFPSAYCATSSGMAINRLRVKTQPVSAGFGAHERQSSHHDRLFGLDKPSSLPIPELPFSSPASRSSEFLHHQCAPRKDQPVCGWFGWCWFRRRSKPGLRLLVFFGRCWVWASRRSTTRFLWAERFWGRAAVQKLHPAAFLDLGQRPENGGLGSMWMFKTSKAVAAPCPGKASCFCLSCWIWRICSALSRSVESTQPSLPDGVST